MSNPRRFLLPGLMLSYSQLSLLNDEAERPFLLSDLRNQPYRRADGGRHSAKWKAGQRLHVSSDISL